MEETDRPIAAPAVRAPSNAGARAPLQQPEFSPALIHRFASGLNLTLAQQRKINPIVRRAQDDLQKLRHETQVRAAFTIERTQDEIALQLNPAQREKFEAFLVERRARLQEFFEEQARRQQGQNHSQGQAGGGGGGGVPHPSGAGTGPASPGTGAGQKSQGGTHGGGAQVVPVGPPPAPVTGPASGKS